MADLTELQSSTPVKLAGADLTGQEVSFVGSTSQGELKGVEQNGVPQHFNGSVTSAGTTITPTYTSREIWFHVPIAGNLAARTLQVSFNSGTNWFTICTRGEKSIVKCEVASFQIRGDNAGTATVYEILSVGK